MSLIKCTECGKEVSDKATACPNCGAPIILKNDEDQENNISYQKKQIPEKKKESVLGIWGLIISFIMCIPIFPLAGLIMCIIAVRDKTKKTTCAKIGIVLSILFLFVGVSIWGSDSSNDKQNIQNVESSNLEEEKNISSTPKPTETPEPTPTPEPIETKEEFISKCEEIPYKTLARNPEDYIGSYIVLDVKIEQILQGGFFDPNQYYRVYTNDEYDLWLGDEYFMYDSRVESDMKLLETDIIKVYGKFLGTETVTRALTNTKEDVPSFEAVYIDLISE